MNFEQTESQNNTEPFVSSMSNNSPELQAENNVLEPTDAEFETKNTEVGLEEIQPQPEQEEVIPKHFKDGGFEENLGLTEEDKINSELQEAIKEIIDNHPDRREYSVEDAAIERPLTHYSYVKNLFQILRFGIHSKNFKNRVDALDPEDKKLDELLPYMRTSGVATCGYQGRDSISLNTLGSAGGLPSSRQLGQDYLLFLVNPEIETWGKNPEERGEQSIHFHGTTIKEKLGIGDYRIGNTAAGENEVLAVNIIKPADIRAVLMPDESSVSVLNDVRETLLKYTEYYLRVRKYRDNLGHTDEMKQEILEDLWVMADTLGDENLIKEIKAIRDEIDETEDGEALENVLKLQDKVLGCFLDGREISENNFRIAISRKFGISLITN